MGVRVVWGVQADGAGRGCVRAFWGEEGSMIFRARRGQPHCVKLQQVLYSDRQNGQSSTKEGVAGILTVYILIDSFMTHVK